MSEKVSVWPASASVAVAVKVRSCPSVTVLSPIGASTGHWFSPPASSTVTWMISLSKHGVAALSATWMVTSDAAGP